MGEVCFEGDPSAAPNSTSFQLYQDGFKVGCFGLVGYSIAMSICSAVIEHFNLFHTIGIRIIYMCAFGTIFVASLIMFFIPIKEVVLALVCVLGLCFAILFTIPLLLLSRYHASSIYRKKVHLNFSTR